MINSKKLAQLSKKWQVMTAIGRRKITMAGKDINTSYTSVAGKGNCIVYTADGRRFKIPLAHLGTKVFAELLRTSQEEFGFTSDGRITLSCDAALMEYMMCLFRREASEEVEMALLSSILMPCHYASSMMPPMRLNQQFTVCSS